MLTMKKWSRLFCLTVCAVFLCVTAASAEFEFSDERFQGAFTTENLDRIIEEYELHDGWYWTTHPYTVQTFHGQENKPGWTDTAVNVFGQTAYTPGYYGCRWNSNNVLPELPALGYGECYAFASFVGYLLSGEYNPHGHWTRYYSLETSGGLRVGDIVRTEFMGEDHKKYQHSAVVYSVSDHEILFLQASGSSFNRISVAAGFSVGNLRDLKSPEDMKKIPDIRIIRSPLNE